jgi:hypothetical protein|tara:strand:+ start:1658 stop:2467 length:810 start_codon:yes stop_codon:yes gene_type:complete
MRKNILILSLLTWGIVACKKELLPTEANIEAPAITLTRVTKPVLFDFTSTGCPGCGSWGGPTFTRIADKNKGSIVPIAVHIKYGDPMITAVSNEIAVNRTGPRYTPQLWVNGNNGVVLNNSSIDGNASVAKMDSNIAALINQEPQMGVGVSSLINDELLSIRYATEAYTDLEGEYSVAVYILEDKLIFNQSRAASNPYEHNYVIRAANNGAFGASMSSEHLRTSAQNDVTLDIDLDENWNRENLYAAVIVWKKDGENYSIVNANNNKIH